MIKTEDSKRSDDWVVSVVGNFVEKRIFRYYSGLTRNWKFGQIWHFQFGQLPICYFPCQISHHRQTGFPPSQGKDLSNNGCNKKVSGANWPFITFQNIFKCSIILQTKYNPANRIALWVLNIKLDRNFPNIPLPPCPSPSFGKLYCNFFPITVSSKNLQLNFWDWTVILYIWSSSSLLLQLAERS